MALLPPAVLGVQEVLQNLKAQEALIGKRVAGAIKLAGLILQRESQKLVPVDTGNLKASAFTRATGEGLSTVVNVGYTAAYALFVHEAVGMKLKGVPRGAAEKGAKGYRGHYWDPQGQAQAKFLEEPLRRLSPKLKQMIANACKI